MVNLELDLPSFKRLADSLQGQNADLQKAIDRTVSDCKSRAAAQITKAVTAVYGIKSSEVSAAGKSATMGAKTVGELKLAGASVKSLQLVYKGRRLTPLHFSMTPRTKLKGKKYTVKAAIYKGQKKRLMGKAQYNTPVFLAPQKQGVVLPFQRTSEQRMPIYAIHTTSIPQMIENEKVASDIKERMDGLFTTRLQHHIDRLKKQ